MPIVVVFDFPGEDTAKYHKVFELGGPAVNAQPSRLDHIWEKMAIKSSTDRLSRFRHRMTVRCRITMRRRTR
jgi:hypothetical protein